MGFYYHIQEVQVRIPAEKLAEAERLLRERDAAIVKNGWKSEIDPQSAHSVLEQVARTNRYSVSLNEQGATIVTPFDTIKGSDNFDWAVALAPVVVSGSYAQVTDDNNDVWRYVFQDGKAYKIRPKWLVTEYDEPYS